MRLLLDTQVFLWATTDDQHLSEKARGLIMNATEVYVSSASIWEAAIKIGLKKLTADLRELSNAILASGFVELPITTKHAECLLQLEPIHKDPFDRILISQTIVEPLRFLTSDPLLKDYSELIELV